MSSKAELSEIVTEESVIQGVNAPLSSFSTREDINHIVDALSVLYGQNASLVKKIIQCESAYKPDAVNYKAVVGQDIGLFQINTHYHLDNAEKMGYDIYNPNDNLEYGFELLKEQGTQPWNWSSKCWQR